MAGRVRRIHDGNSRVRSIAIINQKGGCGKTTSAINIAGLFAKRGYRTLLVDMDPQSHCAAGLAIPEQRIDKDIGDAMLAADKDDLDPARLLWRVSRNLDLAPSRMKLAGLEASRGGLADKADRDRRLAMVLNRLKPNYDICLIDCSPSIGLLTFNALAAATEILIPVETSFFSLQGATKQAGTIRTLSKRLGSTAPYWLLPTLHDPESVLAQDLLDELKRRFKGRLAPTIIRRDSTLKEAASFGQPVVEYAPNSSGARDYANLVDWLITTLSPGRNESDGQNGEIRVDSPVQYTDSIHVEIVSGPDAQTALAGRLAGNERAPIEYHYEQFETDRDHGAPAQAAPDQPTPINTPAPDPAGAEIKPLPGSRAEDVAARAMRLMSKARPASQMIQAIAGSGDTDATATNPMPAENPADEMQTLPRSCGVRLTSRGMLFIQPLTLGKKICIAGDFNGWSPTSTPMLANQQTDVHELCLNLSPGQHNYRLVIDGHWTTDPFNTQTQINGFGEVNSIVTVPDTSAPRVEPETSQTVGEA